MRILCGPLSVGAVLVEETVLMQLVVNSLNRDPESLRSGVLVALMKL